MFDIKYFPGAQKYWYMGEIYDWNTRQVHVMSHVLHYGSSVFEGIRAYNTERGPAIFRLKEHIDRFFKSAKTINMKVPYSKEEIAGACHLIVRENRLRNGYIRPNLFYGYGNLGLTPSACPVELTIGCWEWGAYLGAAGLEKGVHVLLVPTRRFHPSQVNPQAKLGGIYVQSNISASYARQQGFHEALFLNLEGRIAEGPGENILIVKDAVVKTNNKRESVLEGITRTTVLELARDLGYQTEITPITVEDFFNADEAFFTGTAAEVTPIVSVTDGRDTSLSKDNWTRYQIGSGEPGAITRKLAGRYSEVVHGKDPQYDRWLSYIYQSPEELAAFLNGIEASIQQKRLSRY